MRDVARILELPQYLIELDLVDPLNLSKSNTEPPSSGVPLKSSS